MNEIFNEDCIQGMKRYADKYFDLAIVDPPYGLGMRTVEGGTRRNSQTQFIEDLKTKQWDNQIPTEEYWKELFRVSKNQIVWGGNYFGLPAHRTFIVWDKMTYVPTMSQVELAWTSFDSPARLVKINSNQLDRIHPTQKPIKLYEWIINEYAYCKTCHNTGGFYEDVVGDGGSRMYIDCENCDVAIDGRIKILDTHLGSGNSRIAAHKMKVDFVGFEIDKEYFDKSIKRYEDAVAQISLF
jgi:site-specific DNA-methyltransferase (adenine-specific)